LIGTAQAVGQLAINAPTNDDCDVFLKANAKRRAHLGAFSKDGGEVDPDIGSTG
jgi:hypothetical protein